MNTFAYNNDLTTPNMGDIEKYKAYILEELKGGDKTLSDLYHGEWYDIPLYIALHQLVDAGKITGISPYADNSPRDHREYTFSIV
ncbi:MAG: hypothetical protein JRJ00_03310 [Deltaproteobacteria bacterium]|nr:hypothetical protein [Deltaproteobacteria bacterium]